MLVLKHFRRSLAGTMSYLISWNYSVCKSESHVIIRHLFEEYVLRLFAVADHLLSAVVGVAPILVCVPDGPVNWLVHYIVVHTYTRPSFCSFLMYGMVIVKESWAGGMSCVIRHSAASHVQAYINYLVLIRPCGCVLGSQHARDEGADGERDAYGVAPHNGAPKSRGRP